MLEALILASTNPHYDKRFFIDLPVQHMKTTSSEPETLEETIESGPLCITDLFQNKISL